MDEEDSQPLTADISLEPRVNSETSPLPPPVVDPVSNRPGRSSSREPGSHSRSSSRGHSRRSRSNGSRSRNRHRHSSNRRQSRRPCRTYFRHKERNFAAATSSMVAIVLLCIALVPDWIYLKGGGCQLLGLARGSLHHLSTTQFFYAGHFYHNHPLTNPGDSAYHFGSGPIDIMVNCVTYTTVLLFKACIAFTLIAVCCSLVSFILNLVGPENHLLIVLRRNAIFNILTVILCVSVNLFCYWITTSVESIQKASQLYKGSKVEVTFDASFYLITAAAGISVGAVACNCLRQHSQHSLSRESARPPDRFLHDDDEALLADYNDTVQPPPPPGPPPPPSDYPPPPVYTP